MNHTVGKAKANAGDTVAQSLDAGATASSPWIAMIVLAFAFCGFAGTPASVETLVLRETGPVPVVSSPPAVAVPHAGPVLVTQPAADTAGETTAPLAI